MLRFGCTCFAFLFLVLIFPIIEILGLYTYGQVTTITCTHQNAQVDCVKQVTWLNLWPLPIDEILPDVTGARVEINCSSSRTTKVRCYANTLVIENAERSFRIGSPYFNEDSAAETSQRINEYIHQSGPTSPLVIPCRNDGWTIFAMAVVAFLLGCNIFTIWYIFAKPPIQVFGWQIKR